MTLNDMVARLEISRLAREISEHFADLLRALRIRDEESRVYKDPRLTSWLANEARAVVEDGLQDDPWSDEEADGLAERIRAAVLAEKSGVRKVSGSPATIP